jgi:hypothetical protein
MDLRVLAMMLANLQQFEALFETEGIDTITTPGGEIVNLFDLKDLYGQRHMLDITDAVAIEVSLYYSANGKGADDPAVIGSLRRLCEITGTEYKEPSLELLANTGSSFPLQFFGLSRGFL